MGNQDAEGVPNPRAARSVDKSGGGHQFFKPFCQPAKGFLVNVGDLRGLGDQCSNETGKEVDVKWKERGKKKKKNQQKMERRSSLKSLDPPLQSPCLRTRLFHQPLQI